MKVKKVNIYMNKNTREKMTSIAKKNHVSLSTVISELSLYYGSLNPVRKACMKEYMFDRQDNQKTSIKPKIQTFGEIEDRKTNMLLSNLAYLFTEKKFTDYIDQKTDEIQRKKFYTTLQRRKEAYYNYNEQLRNNVRMAKDKNFMAYMEKLNGKQTKRT